MRIIKFFLCKKEELRSFFLFNPVCLLLTSFTIFPRTTPRIIHFINNNTDAGNDSTTGIFISAGGARDDPVASVQRRFEKLWI